MTTQVSTRDRMVTGAAQLLSRAGLAEASFGNVLALTGAPRGSIYHHFPDGKDEMVSAAMRWLGGRLVEALRQTPNDGPEDVVVAFAGLFRRLLTDSGTQAGCAVAAVASSADAGTAAARAAAAVFAAWESELHTLFTASGLSPVRSSALAVTTLAVVEGAIVLARARGSLEPFDTAVHELLQLTSGPAVR